MVFFFEQQLNKRHLRRSRSVLSLLLWGEAEDEDFGKAKNIRQTEILVDMREAILQVARHFQSVDPKNNKVVSNINYISLVVMLKLLYYSCKCDTMKVGCIECWLATFHLLRELTYQSCVCMILFVQILCHPFRIFMWWILSFMSRKTGIGKLFAYCFLGLQ